MRPRSNRGGSRPFLPVIPPANPLTTFDTEGTEGMNYDEPLMHQEPEPDDDDPRLIRDEPYEF